jgi:hypothetical protein
VADFIEGLAIAALSVDLDERIARGDRLQQRNTMAFK